MGGFSNALLDKISGPPVQPPPQPLDQQAKATAIAGEQQAQQSEAQKIQLQQMQLDDQKTLRSLQPQFVQKDEAGKPTGYDWNGLIAAAQGKVMPATLFGLQKQQSDLRQSMATATSDELKNQKDINGQLYERAEGLKGITDPGERQKHYESTLGWAQQHGLNVNQWPAIAPDNDHITALESEFGMHAQALADQKTAAETTESTQKAANEGAQAQLANIKVRLAQNSKPGDFDADIDTVFPPNGLNTGGPNRMYKSLVNSALQRGDVDGARKYIDQASESQQAINKEIAVNTNPQIQKGKEDVAAAEGRARAAIQAGQGMIPESGQPGGQGGTPATIDAVPASIRGRVQQIIDYRGAMPPAGRNNPTNNAIAYWVNALDPKHDDTTFPARNKLMTAYTSGKEATQINAVNTAMGHVGVLGDAIDALNNTNVPALNAVANKLGIAIGNTPATTFKTIVNRVGPELAAAYIQGGGGEGERGTTAGDFSVNKGTDQLKANVGITAKLLRSKIGSLENQYKQTMQRDDFQDRFITPEAQAALDKWSPKGRAASGGGAKTLSMAAIQRAAKDHGVSVDEAKRQAVAAGYTVQ